MPEGGGNDDQHGEGVLGQGGLWWKRAFSWGEKLKKGVFSDIFFDGSQSSWCKMLLILTTVIKRFLRMRRIASCSMEWGGTPWRRRQPETWSDHRDDNNDYDGDKDDGDDGDSRMQECWSDAHIYLFSCLWESCDVWQEMNKNFLEHNIKKLLSSDWGIECNSPFRHVFRCIVRRGKFFIRNSTLKSQQL